MEMPAPSDAASPTKKALAGRPVSVAAAKMGARVETEPSIRPSRPGWMTWRTSLFSSSSIGSSHAGQGTETAQLARLTLDNESCRCNRFHPCPLQSVMLPARRACRWRPSLACSTTAVRYTKKPAPASAKSPVRSATRRIALRAVSSPPSRTPSACSCRDLYGEFFSEVIRGIDQTATSAQWLSRARVELTRDPSAHRRRDARDAWSGRWAHCHVPGHRRTHARREPARQSPGRAAQLRGRGHVVRCRISVVVWRRVRDGAPLALHRRQHRRSSAIIHRVVAQL